MRHLTIFLLLVATLPALAGDGPNSTSIYTAGAHSSSALQLQNLEIGADGSVRGTLVSQSANVIRDVKLLVTHVWHWGEEMKPGEDSPGRSTYFHIANDVPALGTLPFTYVPSPPLLQRDDGRFSTTVEIASYTEIEYHKELR